MYSEGGKYMDGDILLYKRFDEFIPVNEADMFVKFNDRVVQDNRSVDEEGGASGLNGAFFIGTKGNTFRKDVIDYYKAHHYKLADGTYDDTTSPVVMRTLAHKYGWVMEDKEQQLGILHVCPTHFLATRKRYKADKDTFGRTLRIRRLAQTHVRTQDRNSVQPSVQRGQISCEPYRATLSAIVSHYCSYR